MERRTIQILDDLELEWVMRLEEEIGDGGSLKVPAALGGDKVEPGPLLPHPASLGCVDRRISEYHAVIATRFVWDQNVPKSTCNTITH